MPLLFFDSVLRQHASMKNTKCCLLAHKKISYLWKARCYKTRLYGEKILRYKKKLSSIGIVVRRFRFCTYYKLIISYMLSQKLPCNARISTYLRLHRIHTSAAESFILSSHKNKEFFFVNVVLKNLFFLWCLNDDCELRLWLLYPYKRQKHVATLYIACCTLWASHHIN